VYLLSALTLRTCYRIVPGMTAIDPHARAESVWYRVAGLLRRKDLAIDIIEGEIRSAQHEVLLEAARLVLTGEPVEIARQLRERAERTIRPPTSKS
jgi:hypothetical protein